MLRNSFRIWKFKRGIEPESLTSFATFGHAFIATPTWYHQWSASNSKEMFAARSKRRKPRSLSTQRLVAIESCALDTALEDFLYHPKNLNSSAEVRFVYDVTKNYSALWIVDGNSQVLIPLPEPKVDKALSLKSANLQAAGLKLN